MTATFFQLLLAKPARMSIIVYREFTRGEHKNEYWRNERASLRKRG